ncbi:MAG: hypothetical protein OEZ13_08070 [Spirochaetia bacterium]|nr:hypothetical protein [Spirochaetia bacterium]
MKSSKLFTLLVFLCATISVFAQEEAEEKRPKIRIAVLPFEHSEGITDAEAAYLTEAVRNTLIRTGIFEVISNDQIEQMMNIKSTKQAVGPGSCNTEACIIDLGNALECEKMLAGKAAFAFGEYSVTAKILDVVTQKYEMSAESKTRDKDDFPNAAKDVTQNLVEPYGESGFTSPAYSSYMGMLWRTALAPGWGHLHANQKRGWVYLGLWAASAGVFVWSHFNYNTKFSAYENAKSVAEVEETFPKYESADYTRMYMSFAFLGIYAVALGDMFLTGKGYMAHNNGYGGGHSNKILPDFNILPRYTYNNKAETFYEMAIRKEF